MRPAKSRSLQGDECVVCWILYNAIDLEPVFFVGKFSTSNEIVILSVTNHHFRTENVYGSLCSGRSWFSPYTLQPLSSYRCAQPVTLIRYQCWLMASNIVLRCPETLQLSNKNLLYSFKTWRQNSEFHVLGTLNEVSLTVNYSLRSSEHHLFLRDFPGILAPLMNKCILWVL